MLLEERDIFREPLNEVEILGLLREVSLEELLNVRGRTYRSLSAQIEALDKEGLVALMAKEPGLLRRPIIRIDGHLILGFDQRRLGEVLSQT